MIKELYEYELHEQYLRQVNHPSMMLMMTICDDDDFLGNNLWQLICLLLQMEEAKKRAGEGTIGNSQTSRV